MSRDLDLQELFDHRTYRSTKDFEEPPFGWDEPDLPQYWEDTDPRGFDAELATPSKPDKNGQWYCPRCRTASRFIAEPYYRHLAQCRGNLGGIS